MTKMALESPRVPKRNPAGRSCFGLAAQLAVAGAVAAALLVVPFLPLRSAVRR